MIARPPHRRLAAALLAAPLLILLASCESVIASNAAKAHPPQGKLVDVGGGRRIQIDCRGAGSPTIIFQSGGDMLGSLAWAPVLEKASTISRACAYSRAGIMWSDRAGGAFQPDETANDLHAALAAAGEKPPYVLVAHSRGGLYNMIFAGLYRREIAGLVFADSSHPDQEKRYSAAHLSTGDYVPASQKLALAFRWTGLLRLQPYPLDPSITADVRAFYPKSAAANAREAEQRFATLAEAGRYRDLENWPVVVLARELPGETSAKEKQDALNGYLLGAEAIPPDMSDAERREVIWRDLQIDLSKWSSRGRLEVVPNSNHAFFFYRPEVVVEAVKEVVVAARIVTRPPEFGGGHGLAASEPAER